MASHLVLLTIQGLIFCWLQKVEQVPHFSWKFTDSDSLTHPLTSGWRFFSGSIFLSFWSACMLVLGWAPCPAASPGPWTACGKLLPGSFTACSHIHLSSCAWSRLLWTACLICARTHLCRLSVAVPGESDPEQINRWTDVLKHLQYAQLHFTVGLVTLLKTQCLNLLVDPSVMAAALEEAPISTRASKSYQNAKIKEFGNILSNTDRFCNQKQPCMAQISDLDVSPLLEKNK